MKKATIRDVAKAAGVSQSTVSRVLNNNGYVGEDARRRVEEAMEALHYSPSAIAVCLSKSRSRMIGVIVPQIFALQPDVLHCRPHYGAVRLPPSAV